MDKLYTSTSTLLTTQARLIEYTELTQHEIGKENVVLWNRQPLSVDSNIYDEFKVALKKRPCKYYMYNNKLSYSHFCIALLCCIEYSLNSKVTVAIDDKTFIAAWRAIEVISTTANDNVCTWIKKYIANRSAIGYCNALGIVLDNNSIFSTLSEDVEVLDNENDINLIHNLNDSSNLIKKIQYYTQEYEENTNGKIWKTTQTPEGQLYDLQLAHNEYNNILL